MTDITGFMKYQRVDSGYRPVHERLQDYQEVELYLPDDERRKQAARCMDCGVAFCHWACPVANIMPEWHDKLHQGDWRGAFELLQATNNFPEFTGRLCPAPCESACVLGINADPVTIRENELAIIERAFHEGYIQARPPKFRTGKRVAVIGSGPAGLACADTLNKAGHSVVVFEAADALGGYLRYGVPDFKLDKRMIDRRLDLMAQEGVEFRTGVRIGEDVAAQELAQSFDAISITIGARKPRELNVEGRDLDGVYLAMQYLEQSNRAVRGEGFPGEMQITAAGKHVVVIGGGDTGSDCIGTANRQGAASVTQIELLPALPQDRPAHEPWPAFARLYKTTSSHAEGCERLFNISTKKFTGENGSVQQLHAVQVEWNAGNNGHPKMIEVPGSDFVLEADLVLLAMGFEHVVQTGLVSDLGLSLNSRGNIAVDQHRMTNVPGVFAAGDSVRGASLIVWAIMEGREAAKGINVYLSQ